MHALKQLLVFAGIGALVTLGTVVYGSYEASAFAGGTPLLRTMNHPGIGAGLMVESPWSTRIAVSMSSFQRAELMPANLGDVEAQLARDTRKNEAGVPHDGPLIAFQNRLRGTDANDIGAVLAKKNPRSVATTPLRLPGWFTSRLGVDKTNGEVWTFQYTCSAGYPFRCMSHSVLAAPLSRAEPHYRVAVEGGIPSFDPMAEWLADQPSDHWVADAGGTPPFKWQRFVFPLHVRWPALLADIALWGGLPALMWNVPGAYTALRRSAARRRGLCEHCGYSVQGADACPECGKAASKAANPRADWVLARWSALVHRYSRLWAVLHWLCVGLAFATFCLWIGTAWMVTRVAVPMSSSQDFSLTISAGSAHFKCQRRDLDGTENQPVFTVGSYGPHWKWWMWAWRPTSGLVIVPGYVLPVVFVGLAGCIAVARRRR